MDERELGPREVDLVKGVGRHLRGVFHEKRSENGGYLWAGCFAVYVFGGFLAIWWLLNVLLEWGDVGIAVNALVGALLLARLAYAEGESSGLQSASGLVSEFEYEVERDRFWYE